MPLSKLLAEFASLPHLDREVLAAFVLGHDRAWLLAHPETVLSTAQETTLRGLLHRAQTGEPIAYLTGHKEFYGRQFVVSPASLIPRPDSELIIEEAVRVLSTMPNPLIVDVGTGSGCLAITLATERRDARVIGIDTSPEALAIARGNAERIGVAAQCDWRHGDLLAPLAPRELPNLLIANLPYLTPAEGQERSIRHEPTTALVSGTDGTEHYRRLFHTLTTRPIPWVILEFSPTIAKTVQHYANSAGYTGTVKQDLQGLDRVLVLTRTP